MLSVKEEEEEEPSSSSPKEIEHSTFTSKHTFLSLQCMVNEHVFMNSTSLSKKNYPHLF